MICLECQSKTTTTLNYDSWCFTRGSKQVRLVYKSMTLLLHRPAGYRYSMLIFFAFLRAAKRLKLSGLFESVSDFHKFQTYNVSRQIINIM